MPEALKNTYLGGMTFAGLILAMAIQPLSGALSDRTRSRWGRRRPWILAGTLFSLVFLAGMAWAGGFWGLLIGYLLLQLASNTGHGPAQGLIPDLVPTERRGLASGIKNLFDMGGLVVTSLVAGQFLIGMATGIFLSVNWALATDLIPSKEAGKYLGLSNLATAGAGPASRLGGPLIDGVNALRPGMYWGYPALFLLASASAVLGTVLLLRVRAR